MNAPIMPSTTTTTTTTTPTGPAAPPHRPELHVVRDTTPPGTEIVPVEIPPETACEITGPIQVLDKNGNPVAPRPPWDERLRTGVLAVIAETPSLTRKPASFRESLEYSQKGDWAASESGVKRAIHGLATVLVYLVTYPCDLVVKWREKPVGFVMFLVVLFIVSHLAF